MTDLERFTGLLDDFGVKYEVEQRQELGCFVSMYPDWASEGSSKVGGFIGVYAAFTADGTFESMGTDE